MLTHMKYALLSPQIVKKKITESKKEGKKEKQER